LKGDSKKLKILSIRTEIWKNLDKTGKNRVFAIFSNIEDRAGVNLKISKSYRTKIVFNDVLKS
jgi:hypothetical protein